jgi:hypothetical protein
MSIAEALSRAETRLMQVLDSERFDWHRSHRLSEAADFLRAAGLPAMADYCDAAAEDNGTDFPATKLLIACRELKEGVTL